MFFFSWSTFHFLLFTVQWVFFWCSSSLAQGQEKSLPWGYISLSPSSNRRSSLLFHRPERLQELSGIIHFYRTSCWQVPLGQQVQILEPALQLSNVCWRIRQQGQSLNVFFFVCFLIHKEFKVIWFIKLCCLSRFLNLKNVFLTNPYLLNKFLNLKKVWIK